MMQSWPHMTLARATESDNLNLERTDGKQRWSAIIKQRKVAFFLSIILLLYSLSNINYFIFVKKASLLSLLVWNTCTPVSIITVGVLILGVGKRVLSSAMIPLLLWFGFVGLFVFWRGWLEPQLIVFMQGNHLTMTAAALYLARNRWIRKGIYVGIGALILVFVGFNILGPYAPPLW